MALMLQWVSQVDHTPLEDGDASFHPLALRWLRAVEEHEHASGDDQWPLVAKFFAAPRSQRRGLLASARRSNCAGDCRDDDRRRRLESDDDVDEDDDEDLELDDDDDDDEESWDDDEADELYGAAYEDMVYRDSTDDGFDADIIDEYADGTEFELEEEAQRLGQRLEFLTTIARLWRHVAIAWKMRRATTARAPRAARQLVPAGESRVTTSCSSWSRPCTAIPIPQPGGSHDSMVEFDRQRMIKDSLLEQIIATCVETAERRPADPGRLQRPAMR